MVTKIVGYVILLGVVLVWFYFSLSSLMLLVLCPIIIVNDWMQGRTELVILFFNGLVALEWLLIKPLVRLDTKVRNMNDMARARARGSQQAS